MPLRYSWLTFGQAKTALAQRLANVSFWTDAERGVYLTESLRTWNAFTEQWLVDYKMTATPSQVWYNLGTFPGSPRFRTVTDVDLYTTMQYHLLEPPTGGVWTGTTQFALTDLRQALQRRCQEVIQSTGCNLSNFTVPSVTNTFRTEFPDDTLEPRRIRFIPASSDYPPVTFTREDTQAFDFFEPDHWQTNDMPQSWSIASEPPLAMDVDVAPSVNGYYDVVALVSGPAFNPPASSLLGMPDDWSWVAKWGAMADLLSRESEATDRNRANYCLRRYTEGIEIMNASGWLRYANQGTVPCDTPSMDEADNYTNPDWQENPNAWPAVVNAGMDFIAVCPVVTSDTLGVGFSILGNMPIPTDDGEFMQISRDAWDVVLGYAQRLAAFKQGGDEFASTENLEKDFYRFAAATNSRLAKIGIFNDVLREQGRRQDVWVPR